MSCTDRIRDGGEGRGVEGKYIPRGVIGAEILRLDALYSDYIEKTVYSVSKVI